ncbi:MAG TPA: hypothetical protein PLG57_13680, partial [Bacteroidia bacterium]|nr:hypothetical protein [Bacteroidia bacterium]
GRRCGWRKEGGGYVIWDFGFWILNFELGTHWILLIKRDLSRTRIRPDCASTSELNGFEMDIKGFF